MQTQTPAKTNKFWHNFKISRTNQRIISIVLGTKFVILLFGVQSFLLFSNQKLSDFQQVLGIWNNWDAKNYIGIANHGYTATGENSFYLVFFPFYPLLIAGFNFLTNDSILSAFIISGIASIFLGFLFYKLVKLDYSEKTAISSVWFLFIFPTSFFLHIPYTESLFLALVIGSFYFCRKRLWFFAGLLGFFACTTRINGLILCLALPFELLSDWQENRKTDKKWLWLGLIPFGFLAYLLLNYVVTGNFLAFLAIQKNNFQKYLAVPWEAIWEKMKYIYFQPEATRFSEGLFELIFTVIALLAIVSGWRYLRNSYRVWMVASWLLFVSTSWLLSVPRYVLTMFPLFILIAVAARNSLLNVLITTFSILYLGMFIISFVQNRWAF